MPSTPQQTPPSRRPLSALSYGRVWSPHDAAGQSRGSLLVTWKSARRVPRGGGGVGGRGGLSRLRARRVEPAASPGTALREQRRAAARAPRAWRHGASSGGSLLLSRLFWGVPRAPPPRCEEPAALRGTFARGSEGTMPVEPGRGGLLSGPPPLRHRRHRALSWQGRVVGTVGRKEGERIPFGRVSGWQGLRRHWRWWGVVTTKSLKQSDGDAVWNCDHSVWQVFWLMWARSPEQAKPTRRLPSHLGWGYLVRLCGTGNKSDMESVQCVKMECMGEYVRANGVLLNCYTLSSSQFQNDRISSRTL